MSITCESDITTAANRILQDLGPQVVIIKGGHIGEDATDYAFTKDGSVLLGQAQNMILCILMVQAVLSPQ